MIVFTKVIKIDLMTGLGLMMEGLTLTLLDVVRRNGLALKFGL